MKIEYRRVKSRFRQCLYPYEKYHSSGPYLCKNGAGNIGRLRINLICNEDDYFGMNYSTYLWEVAHHRKVRKGYGIDHTDGDKTNDVIKNLQEITQLENSSKGTNEIIKKNIINRNKLFLWCPVCNKRFKIPKWKVNLKKLKKGNEFHFCCKKCAWKAQEKSFVFPEAQKCKKIKQKEFTPANQHENFKKFSKPIYIEKKIVVCDCGKKLPTVDSKYCCKECRIKYGDKLNRSSKVDKEKLIKYCKRSLKKFGRYNYSWIGRKLGVSDKAISYNIFKYKL